MIKGNGSGNIGTIAGDKLLTTTGQIKTTSSEGLNGTKGPKLLPITRAFVNLQPAAILIQLSKLLRAEQSFAPPELSNLQHLNVVSDLSNNAPSPVWGVRRAEELRGTSQSGLRSRD